MRIASVCLLTAFVMSGCGHSPDAVTPPPPLLPVRTAAQTAAPKANVTYGNIPLPPDDLDGLTITHRTLRVMPDGAVVAVVTADNHTRYDLSGVTLTLTLDAQDASGGILPTMTLPVTLILPPQKPGDTGSFKSTDEDRLSSSPVRPPLASGAHIIGYFMTVAHAEGFPRPIDPDQPLSEQILLAGEIGDLDATRSLLRAHPSLIRVRDADDGKTPLQEAAAYNHLALATYLLSHGAAVNNRDKWGETPLYDAVFLVHPQMVRLLLAHGANVRLASNRHGQGWTSLRLARTRASQEGAGAAGATEILRMVEAAAGSSGR